MSYRVGELVTTRGKTTSSNKEATIVGKVKAGIFESPLYRIQFSGKDDEVFVVREEALQPFGIEEIMRNPTPPPTTEQAESTPAVATAAPTPAVDTSAPEPAVEEPAPVAKALIPGKKKAVALEPVCPACATVQTGLPKKNMIAQCQNCDTRLHIWFLSGGLVIAEVMNREKLRAWKRKRDL